MEGNREVKERKLFGEKLAMEIFFAGLCGLAMLKDQSSFLQNKFFIRTEYYT